MDIINSIATWLFKKRMHQIDLFLKYPNEVQQDTFKKLIYSAKNTEWGEKYNYSEITNYNQFKEIVPLNEYDDLKPYIQKMRNGQSNILWPGEVKWYAKSSGTTSDKSKFIPVSTESLEDCHFRGGKDMLTLYCENYENTQIFSGKSLTLSGSWKIDYPNNDTYFGDLSAIILQNLPILAEWARTPSLDIALMDNWEEKIEKICEETIPENVTSLAGVPSWILLILKNIIEKTKANSISEVWPNIEVFFHGGVNFFPYKTQYKEIINKPDFRFWEIYNASEGFFGLQLEKESEDLLLMLDYGVFYEFIDVEDLSKKTIVLDEIIVGKNYEVIINTNSGLWRYKIGDTISFTSNNPYLFRITGRTKNFINAFGEELMIDNAEKAIDVACKKCDCLVKEYTAAPLFFTSSNSGAHEWVIEFEKKPENLIFFAEILDNSLKSLNSDYEAKRFGNMILGFPKITSLNNGVFYTWLKQNNRLGGQYKVPRLMNNRKIIEEIILINQNI
jgi:hypothetical protein